MFSFFFHGTSLCSRMWFINDKCDTSKKSSSVKANSWNAPDPNKLKFNVDATSFKETDMFGWGGILRNHLGEVQATYQMFSLESEIQAFWKQKLWNLQ